MTRSQGIVTFVTGSCFALAGAWFGFFLGGQALATFYTFSPSHDTTGALRYAQVDAIVSGPRPSRLGVSYLLVGVHTADSRTTPTLESVWSVTFAPNYSSVEMLGLALTSEMRAAFIESPVEFAKHVATQLPAPVLRQFRVDSAQFCWVIDTLGGIRLSGAVRDGASTLDYVRAGRDADNRLLRQAAAVQALVAQAAVLGQLADVAAMLLKRIRPSALPNAELLPIADNFSPLQIQSVRVRAITTRREPGVALIKSHRHNSMSAPPPGS